MQGINVLSIFHDLNFLEISINTPNRINMISYVMKRMWHLILLYQLILQLHSFDAWNLAYGQGSFSMEHCTDVHINGNIQFVVIGNTRFIHADWRRQIDKSILLARQ